MGRISLMVALDYRRCQRVFGLYPVGILRSNYWYISVWTEAADWLTDTSRAHWSSGEIWHVELWAFASCFPASSLDAKLIVSSFIFPAQTSECYQCCNAQKYVYSPKMWNYSFKPCNALSIKPLLLPRAHRVLGVGYVSVALGPHERWVLTCWWWGEGDVTSWGKGKYKSEEQL